MKIFLFGATGRVGFQIASRACQDGHRVTAFVRSPDKLGILKDRLTVIRGDALNEEDIASALQDKPDVVISALNTDGTTTLSEAMPLIAASMGKHGIRRLVTIGTAGILQSRTEPGVLRYQSAESKRKLTRAAEEHHRVYDGLRQSDLDWTIVCPTYLPDGERTGSYRVERDMLPEGGSEISVGDTAEFAYLQTASDTYLRARVGIAY
ncbi:NAD(P)-dependent oxidoreductase [Cohnella nanjingensis]|uniref:SDR family oxidoreductase n=1 Tax=Cohnella nanjingensis TaxID=1387779 RepID=A0A7X0RWM6_9BACL|nr:SDR family oxidoreductase [Cohnella nanjingensis]MBB6673710.1 SDR family oxidoreductase [Cohnella nanjingensis]